MSTIYKSTKFNTFFTKYGGISVIEYVPTGSARTKSAIPPHVGVIFAARQYTCTNSHVWWQLCQETQELCKKTSF